MCEYGIALPLFCFCNVQCWRSTPLVRVLLQVQHGVTHVLPSWCLKHHTSLAPPSSLSPAGETRGRCSPPAHARTASSARGPHGGRAAGAAAWRGGGPRNVRTCVGGHCHPPGQNAPSVHGGALSMFRCVLRHTGHRADVQCELRCQVCAR